MRLPPQASLNGQYLLRDSERLKQEGAGGHRFTYLLARPGTDSRHGILMYSGNRSISISAELENTSECRTTFGPWWRRSQNGK